MESILNPEAKITSPELNVALEHRGILRVDPLR
jgi:hypothetical protein